MKGLGVEQGTSPPIAENLARVRQSIAAAARATGRAPGDITLIAVTKSHGADRIGTALHAGHRVFGENRVQEAERKWPAIRQDFADAELHMIGHLQSNKAADAVALFDVIHSVDRPKLAAALAKEMVKAGRRPPCFVQVNTGEEAQKGGVVPGAAAALVAACRTKYDLPVAGLMCIPPADDEPSPHFALLADLARRLGLAGLSMGMSGDYEVAVRLGATHVRVGTSIFGPRGSP